MAEWPTNPDWVEPDDINGGYQYEPADGVTFTDFNSIIADLMYLKAHGSVGLQPQLHAPSLSIDDATLTIDNPSANGDFTSGYKVSSGTTLIATVSSPIVDLFQYLTTPGTYSITAKCCGPNFIDSLASSAVSYVIESAAAPTITDQPDSASYTVGATAVALAVTATGNGTLSYKWQKSTDSGSTWSDISGATSSTYTPDVSTASTYMYRCVVTNTLGATTASTTSNAATIEVVALVSLTFESVNPFTISVASPKWNGTMKYSTDTENWTTWNGSSISSVDGKVYIRGTGNTRVSSDSSGTYSQFVISGTAVECVGNIETLLDWHNVVDGQHPAMDIACFKYAFYKCTALTTAPSLPATTLAGSCYFYMFYGCTNLTTAPSLPATTLAGSCYAYMFYGCTKLTTAPSLPVTTLANYCYAYMFRGCRALTTAPALPATTLADDCYRSMFSDCTKLTTAPALPATTLADDCYNEMFYCCTNLKISTTQIGTYQYKWRIPTEGTISSTPSNWNKNMFTNTGGTFTGNPIKNTTYYVENQPVA